MGTTAKMVFVFEVNGDNSIAIYNAGGVGGTGTTQKDGTSSDGRMSTNNSKARNNEWHHIGVWNETLTASDMAWLAGNAVPEPDSAILGGLAGLLLLRRRRN